MRQARGNLFHRQPAFIGLYKKAVSRYNLRCFPVETLAERDVESFTQQFGRKLRLTAESMYDPRLSRRQFASQAHYFGERLHHMQYHRFARALAYGDLTPEDSFLPVKRRSAQPVKPRFTYRHNLPPRGKTDYLVKAAVDLTIRERGIPGMQSRGIDQPVDRRLSRRKIYYRALPPWMMSVDIKQIHGTGSYPLPPHG